MSRARTAPTRGTIAFLALAALGCGETGPVREPRETIPASVLVRARPPRPGEPPAPLEADGAAAEVARVFQEAGVFTRVDLDDGRGAAPRADYVCEVEVRGTTFGVDRSEVNEKAVLSVLLTGVTGWWIDDRSYPASDVELRARLFAPGGQAEPLLAEVVRADRLELDLWRRGAVWHFVLAVVIPSFWMEDAGRAERALHAEAAGLAGREIAERTRREWPAAALRSPAGAILLLDSPYDAVVEDDSGKLELSAWLASRAPLAEVRVKGAGGRVIARLGAETLAGLACGRRGRRAEEGEEGFRAADARLAGTGPGPAHVYRLEVVLEPADAGWITVEAWAAPGAGPAAFTVPVAAIQRGAPRSRPRPGPAALPPPPRGS